MRTAAFALMLAYLPVSPAVAAEPRVYSELGTLSVKWSEEEKKAPMSQRLLRKTEEASYHVLRLADAEPLHAHDKHDLTIVVLKGKTPVEVGDLKLTLKPGDVLVIRRGVPHRAIADPGHPSEVFAVFTPPYDGQDRREVIAGEPG